jgi:GH43 family beta-xylosidase
MKRFLILFFALLLSVGGLCACQPDTPPPPDSSDSDSETDVRTDAATVTEETTQPQLPEDIPGGPPMENITTYQNPLLTYQTEHAWPSYGYGDPFVMRYNGMYYLYVSTKDNSVGIRCWSSEDLVNWTFEGYCSNDPLTRSAYAPEVYYYNGYFYMYTSPAGNGHYVLRSTSPTKGFEVVTNNMGMSIDGSVFIDNDGKWYFYTAGHGAMQVYDMTSPTRMQYGRPLNSVSVNGGWTEGPMVVYHDGYYYMTYTGNHVLSPSYRILYGVSKDSPLSFDEMPDHNPLLISTSDAVFGIGHSSTVKGPDLDSYYIVYHALLDTLPNRTMNIDRIVFNGKKMEILGPTTTSQQVPDLPDVYHRFEPGSSLKGWSLQGSLSGGSGLGLSADSMLVSKTPFEGDFTAEYNVTSIGDGGMAGALFAYTDSQNYGACYFSPAEQKVIIEITVEGNTTRTEVKTVRSFKEDTRFDCLQSLQIERAGKDYTFYMNDRLLCTVSDSELTGGAIGYITKGAEASFGFIGGTGAVGGRGGADHFKTVSDQGGYIPAYEAQEDISTVTLEDGQRVVLVTKENTLSYRILAAADGGYDLSVLCHRIETPGTTVEVYVDGQPARTFSLSPQDGETVTAILRDIQLTSGQHTLSLRVAEGSLCIESLRMLKAVSAPEIQLDFNQNNDHPCHVDGAWKITDGHLSISGPQVCGKRLYGTPNMGDYEVEVTVTPKTAPNCGLLVRATNPGSPNFLNTDPTADDARAATDWVEGYFVGLAAEGVIIGKQSYGYSQVAFAEGEFKAGSSYKLKVVCEGARILVYVDGKLYVDFTDPDPYMQGMVGVRTHNCSATFDDLSVKPIG